jgi:hypothetical protein
MTGINPLLALGVLLATAARHPNVTRAASSLGANLREAQLISRGSDSLACGPNLGKTGTAYVSVKLSSPNFSIVVTIRSPGFSHTLFSFLPAMTPSGVPVKMMSPGFSVMYWET